METMHILNTPAAPDAPPSFVHRRSSPSGRLERIERRAVQSGLYALAALTVLACGLLGALFVLVGILLLPWGIGIVGVAAGVWMLGIAISAWAAVVPPACRSGSSQP